MITHPQKDVLPSFYRHVFRLLKQKEKQKKAMAVVTFFVKLN
jgi:hypothetical protein